jgi:hypothetical protein
MRTRSDRDSNWTSRWAKVGLTRMKPGLTYSRPDQDGDLAWPSLAVARHKEKAHSLTFSFSQVFSHVGNLSTTFACLKLQWCILLSVAKLNSNKYKKIWTTSWAFLQLRLDCHFDHAMLRVFITSTSCACPSWACDLCRTLQVTMNIWFDLPHWQTPLD